jgi:hypothetical protein
MKFLINEKVKVKKCNNTTLVGTIISIKEQISNVSYTICLENGIIMNAVPQSVLEKMVETAKISAFDILKDKTGGQMAVSISAIQKILNALQSSQINNKKLKQEIAELRTKSISQNELIIQLRDRIDKLTLDNDKLTATTVKMPVFNFNELINDIDISELN